MRRGAAAIAVAVCALAAAVSPPEAAAQVHLPPGWPDEPPPPHEPNASSDEASHPRVARDNGVLCLEVESIRSMLAKPRTTQHCKIIRQVRGQARNN